MKREWRRRPRAVPLFEACAVCGRTSHIISRSTSVVGVTPWPRRTTFTANPLSASFRGACASTTTDVDPTPIAVPSSYNGILYDDECGSAGAIRGEVVRSNAATSSRHSFLTALDGRASRLSEATVSSPYHELPPVDA